MTKKQPSSDLELARVRGHMRALPWEDLYPRLLLRAAIKTLRIPWKGEGRGRLDVDQMARDAVQEGWLKLFDGERRWDWDKSDHDNLWNAVGGVIINRGTARENTWTSRLDDKLDAPSNAPSPEDEAVSRIEVDRLLRFLRGKDLEAARMAELMLRQGLAGTKELAEAMGLQEHQVLAAKRRLERLVEAYKANKGREAS